MMRTYRQADRLRRAVRRTAATRPMARLYGVIQQPLDLLVHRRTRGRTTLTSWLADVEVTMLTTTGARSGLPRTVPVLGLDTDDGLLLIASNFGRPRHPGWYHNLRADPRATVVTSGVRREVVGLRAGRRRARRRLRAGRGDLPRLPALPALGRRAPGDPRAAAHPCRRPLTPARSQGDTRWRAVGGTRKSGPHDRGPHRSTARRRVGAQPHQDLRDRPGQGGRARRRERRPRGRPLHGGHGPERLGQVDPDALLRRPRHRRLGLGRDRRPGPDPAQRQGAHPAAPRRDRLRVPVLQPGPDPHRGREHPAAPGDRRTQARPPSGTTRSSRRSASATG